MGVYSIIVSIILGFIIIFVQVVHAPKNKFSVLTACNFIYFVCFVFVPLYLQLFSDYALKNNAIFSRIPYNHYSFFAASALSLLAYVAFLYGYYFGRRDIGKRIQTRYMYNRVFLVANLQFIVGIISLILYVKAIGGIDTAIYLADEFRGESPPVETKWAFLKNLAPTVQMASYIYFAMLYKLRNKKNEVNINKKLVGLLFIISFIASLFLLFHKAGRLGLISYLIVFPVSARIYRGKFKMRFIILGFLAGILFLLYGDFIFTYLFARKVGITREINYTLFGIVDKLAEEFCFPYVVTANSFIMAEDNFRLRFFIDIFIGLATFIPKQLLNIHVPEPISDIVSRDFGQIGTIPADLMSFGYLSFGATGVAFVFFILGIFAKFINNRLSDENIIDLVYKNNWILFLAFRIMYGDPSHAMKSGFYLIFGTILLKLCTVNHQRNA